MEYRVSHFPMLSRFFLTANEKDFSLALEMTVRGKAVFSHRFLSHEEGLCLSPLAEASHSAAYQK